MGKHLSMAIVGCGDVGGSMALVSRLIPQVRLAACCDVDEERARRFTKRFAVYEAYSDYREMLANPDLDIVYLAVPHHLHYEMILLAIGRRLPVLVEKPITRTLAEGVQIVEKIAQLGVKVGVNYQYRYDKGCFALARAVQEGAIGRVFSVRINIPWHRERVYFENASWHKTIARAGGGTLITQGSHFLDVALWALGEKPVSAMGFTAIPGFDVEVETLAHGIVETDAGTLVNITCTMAAAAEQAVTIEIYGEQGTAVYRNRPRPHVKFTGITVRKQPPPERGVHAIQRSLAGFVHWVCMGKPYLIPAAETLPVLAAVDAIYRSAQSGKREQVSQY